MPALVLLFGFNAALFAQQQSSFSIKATAIVTSKAEIELFTINDLLINADNAVNGIVYISPINDENAGKILIKGKSDAQMRLSFVNQLSLSNASGKGTLLFEYQMSGYNSDNKHASRILDALEQTLQFNSNGEYYIWVGGRVDISNAQPGNYEGEFTLEVEYL